MAHPLKAPVHQRALGIVFIVVAAISWGTWPLYTREGAPPGLVVGFLTLTVMALPAPFVFRRAAFADRGAVGALVLAGLADAGNVALYFPALAGGPTVVAVLTHYLAPTLVALAAPLVHEPRSRRALLASPMILLGLTLVLGDSPGDARGWLRTALFGAGSAVFYALNVLGSRRAQRTFSAGAVTSLHAVVGAATLLLCFGREALPVRADAGTWWVLFGALVNGLGGALLFNHALRRLGAQRVGVITYLEPLTAALIGVLWLGQPFTPLMALGGGLVLVAGAWAAAEPALSGRDSSI